MALSIFAGTGMEVRAEEEWYFEEVTPPDTETEEWKNGIIYHLPIGDDEWDKIGQSIADDTKYNDGDVFIFDYVAFVGTSEEIIDFDKLVTSDKITYNIFTKNTGSSLDNSWSSDHFDALLRKISTNKLYVLKQRSTTSDTSDSGSGSESSTSNAPYVPHTHSYSWVTVQDVTADQDGIEEYRCSCGDVQERCVIPRYMAIVKGLCGAVKDAPQNGTATFDTGSAFTMTDYVIRKLSERADVTTVITFEYQSQSYRMTIPAGVDYTPLLTDGDYFYGYFYFANAVGATIEVL